MSPITKNQRIIIKYLFIIVPILAAAYPIVNKYYIIPYKWKREFIDNAMIKYPNIDKGKIDTYCDCNWNNFITRYDIYNFPSDKDYSKADLYGIAKCVIEHILADSVKERSRKNIDKVVEYMYAKYHTDTINTKEKSPSEAIK